MQTPGIATGVCPLLTTQIRFRSQCGHTDRAACRDQQRSAVLEGAQREGGQRSVLERNFCYPAWKKEIQTFGKRCPVLIAPSWLWLKGSPQLPRGLLKTRAARAGCRELRAPRPTASPRAAPSRPTQALAPQTKLSRPASPPARPAQPRATSGVSRRCPARRARPRGGGGGRRKRREPRSAAHRPPRSPWPRSAPLPAGGARPARMLSALTGMRGAAPPGQRQRVELSGAVRLGGPFQAGIFYDLAQ